MQFTRELGRYSAMDGYFKRVQQLTASRFWINNVTLDEAQKAIDAGATGCTQNPSYVWKMMTAKEEQVRVDASVKRALEKTKDVDDALVMIQRDLVADVANMFLPLYKQSFGRLGYVSIQGNPFKEDAGTILKTARFNREAGHNIMIKIPVTKEGLEAIGACIAEGMPVNATEVMSIQQAIDLIEVYEKAAKGLEHPPVVYLSHIAGIFDEYINNYVAQQKVPILGDVTFQGGKIVAKKIRAYMDERKTAVGFINGGARGLHHFTEWVGADISTTINWKGTAEDLLELNPPVVARFDNPVPESVLDELLAKLPDFKKAYMIGGLHVHDYEEFGPVELFCSSFRKAWGQARERIASLL